MRGKLWEQLKSILNKFEGIFYLKFILLALLVENYQLLTNPRMNVSGKLV